MGRKKYITDDIDIFNAEGGVSTEIGYDPFNILTWQLSPNTFSVSAEDTAPEELFFKPDGSKMYVLGRAGDDIDEYALSTPWDITTATYTDQLSGLNASPSNENNPYGLFISPDGINIYITGFDQDQVIQWVMSTAWDISTGTYLREKDLLNQGGSSFSNPNSINFKEDGLQMFVQSYTEDIIINYTLSTAWDISGATYTSELSLLNIYDPIDLAPDGSNFSLSAANSFRFNTAGTVMIIADSSKDSLFQIDLTTAWDITTAVFFSGLYRSSSYDSSINGLFLSQNAYKVFTVGSADRVREINTGGTLFNSLNDTSVGFDGGLNVEGNVTIARDLSVGTFNTTSSSNFYGGLTTHTTTQLAHGNGGTVRILDGSISTGRPELKIMTNSGWGTNSSNQGQQYTERTNTLNLARPYGGALVQVNIGSLADAAGTRVPHSGIVEIDSKAQTFNHSGSFSVGKTIQVEGNYDYETLSIPGASLGFNDTFTASTTVELTSHTPDLGGSWVNVLTYPGATNTRTMQVKGGLGYMQSSGSDRNSEGLIYSCGTTPTSVNYDVKATFYRQDSSDDVVHLIIKYVDNDNYYFLTWSASYGQTELRKKENGVVTTVSAIHPDDPFRYGVNNNTSDGSNVTLRIRFINSSIMVWNSGTDDNGVVEEFFRGTFPVTGDFNDGDGGVFHKVAFGIGSINAGDSTDLTDEWKISQFELYNLPAISSLDDSTVSYINTGSVGIGTTSPSTKLEVVDTFSVQRTSADNEGLYVTVSGSDANAIIESFYQEDSNSQFGYRKKYDGSTNLYQEFIHDNSATGTEVYRVDRGTKNTSIANGNVGIGTTSPANKLTINDTLTNGLKYPVQIANITSGDGAGTSGGILFNVGYGGTSRGKGALVYNSNGTGYNKGDFMFLQSSVADTSQPVLTDAVVTIKNNGNVGIGTTSPSTKLHVGDGTADDTIRVSHSDGSYTEIHGYGLYMSRTDSYIRPVTDETQSLRIGHHDKTWNNIIHNANNHTFNNDNSEWLRITSNGNVGIGTTSPSTKLDVNGNIAISSTSPSSASGQISMVGGRASFGYDGSISSAFMRSSDTSKPLVFGSGASELMRIVSSNGNVGIGTTSPTQRLDVAGSINVSNLLGYGYSLSTNSISSFGSSTKSMATPPNGYLWHDLFAFSYNYTVTQEQYDGTTWSSATAQDGLFIQKQDQAIEVISSSNTGVRWTFDNVSWSSAQYLNLSFTYVASDIAKNILVETSTDNSTWTTRFTNEAISGVRTFSCALSAYSGDAYLRITITKAVASSNTVRLSQIRLLTARLGDQGQGGEQHYPYTWNSDRRIGISTALSQTLLKDLTIGVNGGAETSMIMYSDLYNSSLELSNQGDISMLKSSGSQKLILSSSGTSGHFIVDTNDSERMRVTSAGNVGIGTTSPSTKLHVIGNLRAGAAADYVELTTSGNVVFSDGTSAILATTSGTQTLSIGAGIGSTSWNTISHQFSNEVVWNPGIFGAMDAMNLSSTGNLLIKGDVGIGTASPVYELDVSGEGRFTGVLRCLSLVQTSQTDKKEGIQNIDKTKAKAIQFKEYRYKEDSTSRKRYGVLAEDLEQEYPELVYTGADGVKGISYTDLLIKRVAELEQELEQISVDGLNGNVFVNPFNNFIGIGTTKPLAKLDVVGDLKMKDAEFLPHYLTMSPGRKDVYINKDLNNTVFFGDTEQPSTTNISVAADIESRGGGLVLTSPKGLKFKITVDDKGGLISSPV